MSVSFEISLIQETSSDYFPTTFDVIKGSTPPYGRDSALAVTFDRCVLSSLFKTKHYPNFS